MALDESVGREEDESDGLLGRAGWKNVNELLNPLGWYFVGGGERAAIHEDLERTVDAGELLRERRGSQKAAPLEKCGDRTRRMQ